MEARTCPSPLEQRPACPASRNGLLMHLAGLGVLVANRARYALRGYRTPRPTLTADPGGSVAYDRAIVDLLQTHLDAYRPGTGWEHRRVLELGPGPDIGTGLVLLARGALSYAAVDVFPLMELMPEGYSGVLAESVARAEDVPEAPLREVARSFQEGQGERLRYLYVPRFTLESLPDASVDTVIGNASFEHFDDVDRVAAELRRVTVPGALLVAEVDLQTHTGVLRERDPLNIYRYRSALYDRLRFSGGPNRRRPAAWVEAFRRHGWGDPCLYPRVTLDDAYTRTIREQMAPEFREDPVLGWLQFVICLCREP